MSKRTKLKVRNLHLFFAKNVFNSRYIVRNLLALTVMITFAAAVVGAVTVFGNRKTDPESETQQVTGSIEEVATLDGSTVSMDASGTSVLRAAIDAEITAGKEAKEKEVVAAAASEFADKFAANKDDVNVRAEASTDSEIVGTMNTGACGDVLSQADGWVQISSGEVTGYVKADYVTLGEDAYALAQQYYTATAVAKEDGVNLRAGASTDAEIIGAVYENVTYTVTPEKTSDEWVCLAVAADTEGYASADYMEVTEGYRVAEPSAIASDNEDEEEVAKNEDTEDENTTEASGSVNEVTTKQSPSTSTTTEKQTTTTQATTQVASDSSNIGTTARGSVTLSDADINLMAAVMTLECGSESYEGQLAVANVILNRLERGIGGSTISGVVYAANQFSVVSDSRFQGLVANGAQASCIQAARDACAGNNNIGDLIYFRPASSINTSSLGTYKQIGNHVFYK